MPGSEPQNEPGGAPRVFGPVPSWRLGRSLGVDLAPFKRCNWNCVYCQLGRTRPLRAEPLPTPGAHEILAEVCAALERVRVDRVDWITLLGSGEPLVCAAIGEVLEGIKAMTPLPVAILTNGALLADPAVRHRVRFADAVLPSLAAPTPQLHRALHRPHPRFPFQLHLQGLHDLRREFGGRIWVEVMLVAGANDGEEELRGLAHLLHTLSPDEIHLNRPTRPPAEAWVRPTTPATLARAREILGEVAVVRVPAGAASDSPEPAGALDQLPRLLSGILQRHPMTRPELARLLPHIPDEVLEETLRTLGDRGILRVVPRLEREFWVWGEAWFPDPSASHPPPILRRPRPGSRSTRPRSRNPKREVP